MQQSFPDRRVRLMPKVSPLLASLLALVPTASLAAIDTALLPRNLSPWGMFLNADIVVKVVMVGLAFASAVTWTIWLAKTVELRLKTVIARRRLGLLARDASLADLEQESRGGRDAVAQIIQSAAREASLSGGVVDDGFRERVSLRLDRVEAAIGRQVARGTGLLATIGATAPFVGLFGTVWGIMNSFIGISEAHTTNLAVVAPGIAEALLATALGLVAAPPAPRTTASPRAERQAPVMSAVSAGASAAAIASYNQLVAAHLRRFKQYPPQAKAAGERGVARLSFSLGRDGQVLASRLGGSSGHAALDAETLAMVRRAQPFPAFPAEVKQATMSFSVPVDFSLR
jgi:biopolymer transport protein ExbB